MPILESVRFLLQERPGLRAARLRCSAWLDAWMSFPGLLPLLTIMSIARNARHVPTRSGDQLSTGRGSLQQPCRFFAGALEAARRRGVRPQLTVSLTEEANTLGGQINRLLILFAGLGIWPHQGVVGSNHTESFLVPQRLKHDAGIRPRSGAAESPTRRWRRPVLPQTIVATSSRSRTQPSASLAPIGPSTCSGHRLRLATRSIAWSSSHYGNRLPAPGSIPLLQQFFLVCFYP